MLKRRSSFQVGGSVPPEEKPLRIPREYASLVGLDDIDTLFKTSRGSTYAYHANKTSTRNRSGEQHTDKTTGIQPRSGKTVFMSNDDVNRVAGIFQNAEMATQLVPVMDEQGRPTGKAKLELLEDYGPRKKGSTLITVSYTTTPAVGLAPVEIYRSESKMGDSGRGIHFGTPITEVINKPVRAAGKAGLMAAALGGAGGASAAEIAESFLPLGMTPSTLAPGTLTPEQKAASDEAYRRKLAEERAAKMKAQALLRSGVKQEEPQMAKGGMMARNIPGFQEGGANVDPVSGNEVPTGSMPEEVRDDIDAKLSPGEFVLPADVVRFIGLERLMKMRDEAKKGLQRMSDIGQMGNADEVGEASNGTYEDAGFESEIDDILGEIEAEEQGRDVNEQTEVMMAQGGVAVGTKTNQTTTAGRPVYRTAEGDNVSELSITVPFKGFWANVPSIHNGVKYDEDQIVEMLNKGKIKPTSVHESIKEAVDAAKARSAGLLDKPEMAQGGFMKSGTDLTKAPKNPVFDVRYYKNAEGSVMYITHINGKPMTPIPEGYKAVTQEEAQKVGQKAEEAAKAVQTTNESGGYDATQLDKSVADFLDEEARQQAEFDAQSKSKEGPREQRMGKVSNVIPLLSGQHLMAP
jgi:Arc/MetJ-type ribon-helix-helix transcriptional regulator